MHERNSQEFYNDGRYVQAQQQAEMALNLDAERVGMRLMRGFCLVKLGKARGEAGLLNEAVNVFEDLVDTEGDGDYRIWLGTGQAHLARALLHSEEIAKFQRRLDSDFLDEEGREVEMRLMGLEEEDRQAHLKRAERCLGKVLTFDFQDENSYALIDLVLVLNSIGGREDDALALSRRAVDILVQSNELTNSTLQKNINLSSAAKLNLERRIDDNLNKERMLRDIIATLEYNRGDLEASLAALNAMDERQLMTVLHYFNRASLNEQLGYVTEAVADLYTFLRLRAQTDDSFDEVVEETFERIDELVELGATLPDLDAEAAIQDTLDAEAAVLEEGFEGSDDP